MFIILPSLASGRLTALADEAVSVKDAGYLHLDIEDGNFSPGITFGPDTVHELAGYTDAEMDAHLMVNAISKNSATAVSGPLHFISNRRLILPDASTRSTVSACAPDWR